MPLHPKSTLPQESTKTALLVAFGFAFGFALALAFFLILAELDDLHHSTGVQWCP